MKDVRTYSHDTLDHEDPFSSYVTEKLEEVMDYTEDLTPVAQAEIDAIIHAYSTPHNEAMRYKQEILGGIYSKYPYFFHKDIRDYYNIPVGWLRGLEQAFDTFTATGLSVLIYNIYVEDGKIEVDTTGEYLEHILMQSSVAQHFSTGTKVLKSLLKPISKSCMLCGNTGNMEAKEKNTQENHATFALCPQCQKYFYPTAASNHKKTTQCKPA